METNDILFIIAWGLFLIIVIFDTIIKIVKYVKTNKIKENKEREKEMGIEVVRLTKDNYECASDILETLKEANKRGFKYITKDGTDGEIDLWKERPNKNGFADWYILDCNYKKDMINLTDKYSRLYNKENQNFRTDVIYDFSGLFEEEINYKFEVGDSVIIKDDGKSYLNYKSWFKENECEHLEKYYKEHISPLRGYICEVVAIGKHREYKMPMYAVKVFGCEGVYLIGELGLAYHREPKPTPTYTKVEMNVCPRLKEYNEEYPKTVSVRRPFITRDYYKDIDKIIQNKPYTIIKWKDGTTTKAKCNDNDSFDLRVGFAIAFTKKFFNSNGLDKVLREKSVLGKDKRRSERTNRILEELKEYGVEVGRKFGIKDGMFERYTYWLGEDDMIHSFDTGNTIEAEKLLDDISRGNISIILNKQEDKTLIIVFPKGEYKIKVLNPNFILKAPFTNCESINIGLDNRLSIYYGELGTYFSKEDSQKYFEKLSYSIRNKDIELVKVEQPKAEQFDLDKELKNWGLLPNRKFRIVKIDKASYLGISEDDDYFINGNKELQITDGKNIDLSCKTPEELIMLLVNKKIKIEFVEEELDKQLKDFGIKPYRNFGIITHDYKLQENISTDFVYFIDSKNRLYYFTPDKKYSLLSNQNLEELAMAIINNKAKITFFDK